MQVSRCPVCHSRINLETLAQDEAGRELLGLLAQLDTSAGTALATYLGLFRSATRDLANDRALRLAIEIQELGGGTFPPHLCTAMAETVQGMRAKQDEGTFKPLTNHNYLKRVLESVEVQPTVNTALTTTQTINKPQSKTAQGIELLKNYPTPEGVPDWFTRTVCGSLAELMLMGLEGVPAFDTLPMVAERWLNELWPKREWKKDCRFKGAARLHTALLKAAEHRMRWPSVKDVLAEVPRA